MKRTAAFLLTLFAFAVPWEYALDFGEPFGNIARILSLLSLLFVLACLVEGRVHRLSAFQWLVLAFYLYFACSYVWSVDQATTVGKIRSYLQVIMPVWLLWQLIENPSQLRDIMRGFVAGCWVLAILTLLNFSSASAVVSGQIRFAAEGQDPNDVARFLVLGMPLGTLLFATDSLKLSRWLALLYLPVALLAVLLTASRGGFSASLLALIGSTIILVKWRPHFASSALVIFTIVAGILWQVVPSGTVDRLRTIPEQLGSSDLNARSDIWVAGWNAFEKSPWLGYGAGTYTEASGLAQGDTAHNTLMAVLVTGGVVAITLFLLIISTALISISRNQGLFRTTWFTVFAVWATTAFVGSVEENRATWLILGSMAVAGRLARHPDMSACFDGTQNPPRKHLHIDIQTPTSVRLS